MARGPAGRPKSEPRSGRGYALANWLNENLDEKSSLNYQELADALGYSRPNIISMWRSGNTRVPLQKLAPLAKLLNVDFLHLLRLWHEQYADEEGYNQIEAALNRMASPSEAQFLGGLRQASFGRNFKLRDGWVQALADFIEIQDGK